MHYLNISFFAFILFILLSCSSSNEYQSGSPEEEVEIIFVQQIEEDKTSELTDEEFNELVRYIMEKQKHNRGTEEILENILKKEGLSQNDYFELLQEAGTSERKKERVNKINQALNDSLTKANQAGGFEFETELDKERLNAVYDSFMLNEALQQKVFAKIRELSSVED